jgi:hypothetical protein
MASSSGKRTSSSGRTRKSTTSSRNRQAQRSAQDSELFHEIGLIVLFVAMLILFCCNFGITGTGSSGDQHMGHLGNIRYYRLASNILTYGKSYVGIKFPEFVTL